MVSNKCIKAEVLTSALKDKKNVFKQLITQLQQNHLFQLVLRCFAHVLQELH
jgi:hypothetical protein